jgi:hypothetical protein
MKTLHVSLLASAVLVFGSAAGLVRADIIVNPISAADNYHWSGQPASKTIDGSGLSDAGLVDDGDAVPTAWPTNTVSDTTGFADNFVFRKGSEGYAAQVATYTLANAVDLSGGHFWQYGGDDASRALLSAEIWVSPTDVWGAYTLAGTLSGYARTAEGQDPGAKFSLNATGVKYVQLRNMLPYSVDPAVNGMEMVGFGEIRFTQTTLPEPGALVLLAMGVSGLLCYAWRKRKCVPS